MLEIKKKKINLIFIFGLILELPDVMCNDLNVICWEMYTSIFHYKSKIINYAEILIRKVEAMKILIVLAE